MSTNRAWYGTRDLEKRFGRLTLGLFLKAFREADGLSQSIFAKKLGVSSANLCDLERGRKFPSPVRAARIARSLGVSEIMLIQLAIQDSLRANNLKYSVELKRA